MDQKALWKLTYGMYLLTAQESGLDNGCIINTAVQVAGLVPWSIAGGVPLASVGAPSSSMLLGCFLYLVPAWRLLVEARKKKLKI